MSLGLRQAGKMSTQHGKMPRKEMRGEACGTSSGWPSDREGEDKEQEDAKAVRWRRPGSGWSGTEGDPGRGAWGGPEGVQVSVLGVVMI
jgi:hypothetical protein